MAITGFELVQVATEYVTCDLIIWKRYMNRAPGMVEVMMDANPQLAYAHRVSPFLPVGVYLRVPIDPVLLAGKPVPRAYDSLWTDKKGYTV
jgi:phage tail protein X